MNPISPEECIAAQYTIVPEWVIDLFNDLITQKWDGTKSVISEKYVEESINSKGYSFNKARNGGMLKIEPLYARKGWNVRFDTENQDNKFWIFTISKSR